MGDRLKSAVIDLRQEFLKANVQLLTIGKACVYLIEEVDKINVKLDKLDGIRVSDGTTEGSSPKKRKGNDSDAQNDVFSNRYESGSLLIGGLFNGEYMADRSDFFVCYGLIKSKGVTATNDQQCFSVRFASKSIQLKLCYSQNLLMLVVT